MSQISDEMPAASPGQTMRRLQDGICVLLIFLVAALGAKVISISAEITILQTALRQVPARDVVQQELEQLSEQFRSNAESVKSLSASLTTLSAVSAVDKPAFEQLVKQVQTLETKVNQPETADALKNVHATMVLLQSRVEALEKRAVDTATIKPAISAAAVTKSPTRKAHVRLVAAPFRLTSIERRGGALFAAVAPLQAFDLADIRLVGAGETIQGWTLLSAAGNQAKFRVAGQTQTLHVQ